MLQSQRQASAVGRDRAVTERCKTQTAAAFDVFDAAYARQFTATTKTVTVTAGR